MSAPIDPKTKERFAELVGREELVRKELLRPDQALITGEDAFRFRHLLIRDAAYDSMPKSTRAELHEKLGRWLEEHGRDLVELDELLGYHLEQACNYRTDLRPLDDHARELAARAGEQLTAAGLRALDHGDKRAAVNLLGRAIKLHEHDDPAVSLRLDLADALEDAGQLDLAEATAKEAAARAEAAADQLGALRARLRAERFTYWSDPEGASARVLALVNEARPLFEQAGDDRAMMEVYLALALVERMHLQSGAEVLALEQAGHHARRVGDKNREREILGRMAFMQIVGPTPVEQTLRWLDTPGVGFDEGFGYIRLIRPRLEAMLGRFDRARALVAAAFERFAELGIRRGGERSVSWHVETLHSILRAHATSPKTRRTIAADLGVSERTLRRYLNTGKARPAKLKVAVKLAVLFAQTMLRQTAQDSGLPVDNAALLYLSNRRLALIAQPSCEGCGKELRGRQRPLSAKLG